MENKDLLYRMAEIKTTIKKLEAEYKENEGELINAITELNPDTMKVDVGDIGRFSVSSRKVWEYSPAVSELEASVKSLKSEEEATGVAEYTEVPRVTFTTRKED